MKTLSLKAAFDILQNAAAIIVDDNFVIYPSLDDLVGEEDNEFMYISWEDDGSFFNTKFREGENQEVKVSGSSLFLVDYEGDECQISILVPQKLEAE